MKNVVLAWIFFRKHLFANLIVIIEIVMVFTMILMVSNRTIHLYKTYSSFSEEKTQQFVYFMGRTGSDVGDGYSIGDYLEALQSDIKELPYIEGVSSIGFFDTAEGETLITIDDLTLKRLPHSKAIQSIIDRPDDNSALYYGNTIEKNQTIDRELLLYKQYKLHDDDEQELITSKQSLDIIKYGKKLDSYIFQANYKSNMQFPIERVLYDRSLNYDRNLIIMSSNNSVLDSFQIPSDNFFIYLNSGYSQEDIEQLGDFLDLYGDWAFGTEMVQKSKIDANNTFLYDVNQLVVIIVIAGLSLICITFINIKKFARYISIYMLNGCKKVTAVFIYYIYLLGILFVSTGLFYALLSYLNITIHSSGRAYSDLKESLYAFNPPIQIATFTIILIYLTFGSLIPFYIMSKKSKINFMKEN